MSELTKLLAEYKEWDIIALLSGWVIALFKRKCDQ